MGDSDALLRLSGISRSFPSGAGEIRVLDNVDLTVKAGESLAIVGPSGCGKSTLLNLIGALDRPTSGSIVFEERDLAQMNEGELASFRNGSVGFVFQLHHLLPQCTALENVLVPTLVKRENGNAEGRAKEMLARVGLADRMQHRPGLLSGGERQRVAVVRALINEPKLLLADEPTGSLSESGAEHLANLMIELQQSQGMAMIVVTHAPAISEKMGRVVELSEGRLGAHASA